MDLAKKYSEALDFPKTGVAPALLTNRWADANTPPERYERAPDFAMKEALEPQYESGRLNGQLFRHIVSITGSIAAAMLAVKIEAPEPNRRFVVPQWDDEEVASNRDEWMERAAGIYQKYAYALQNLVEFYGIECEGELFASTYSVLRNRLSEREADDMSYFNTKLAIEKRFRSIVCRARTDFLGSFVSADGACNDNETKKMLLATACYLYVYENKSGSRFFSFPWAACCEELEYVCRKNASQSGQLGRLSSSLDSFSKSVSRQIAEYLGEKADQFYAFKSFFDSDEDNVDLGSIKDYINMSKHSALVELMFFCVKWALRHELVGEDAVFSQEQFCLLVVYGLREISHSTKANDGVTAQRFPQTISEMLDSLERMVQGATDGLGAMFVLLLQFLSSKNFLSMMKLDFTPFGSFACFVKKEWQQTSEAAQRTYHALVFKGVSALRTMMLPDNSLNHSFTFTDDAEVISNNHKKKALEEAVFVAEVPGLEDVCEVLVRDNEESRAIRQRFCSETGCFTMCIREHPVFKKTENVTRLFVTCWGSRDAVGRLRQLFTVCPQTDQTMNCRMIAQLIAIQILNKLRSISGKIGAIFAGNDDVIETLFLTWKSSSMEKPLELRPYQEELVGTACEGRNVVICAPTGSGKTIIAAHIIRDHVYKAIRAKRFYKVGFFVPTNCLVHQQKSVLKDFLGHCSAVLGVCGESDTHALRHKITVADVIVSTPQLIVNLLTQKPPSDRLMESFVPFDLSSFTLIFFDEAHHNRCEHPYSVIMDFYHEMKLNRETRSAKIQRPAAVLDKRKLPQVIGMTASLGVGESSSESLPQAIDFILSICAKFNAHTIDFVRVQIESLRAYVNLVAEETKFVGTIDVYSSGIYKLLSEKIAKLRANIIIQIPEAANDVVYNVLAHKNGENPQSIAFSNWVFSLENFIAVQHQLSAESRKFLDRCAGLITKFYYAIEMTRLFGAEFAINYLEQANPRLSKDAKRGKFIDALKETVNELRALPDVDVKLRSPLFVELIRTLDAIKPDDRVLIFLQKREYCIQLARLLNEHTTHRASYIIGLNTQGYGSATQDVKTRQSNIKCFADGSIKILCATTVAEEGLDIAACNLIIHYNFVSDEIAKVQRKGRARAPGSRSVLLTCDARIVEKDRHNSIRESLMYRALEHIRLGDMKFMIEQKILALNRERVEAAVQEKARNLCRRALKENGENHYFVLCRRCGSLLGHSQQMFVIASSHYVLCNEEIWKNMDVHDLLDWEKENAFTQMSTPIVGTMFCRNVNSVGAAGKLVTSDSACGNKIGRVLRHRSVYLPTCSIKKGVVFMKSDYEGQSEVPRFGKRIVKKKWKEVVESMFDPDEQN